MKNKKILIGLIVLLLAVGFAAVTTTLYINGKVTYQTNKDDFNVIYTGAVSSEENLTTSKTNDKASAKIESDKKHITFKTQDLAVVGEWARVDYEITNFSRNYDANVTVSWTLDNSADQAFYNEYLEIENHENWTGNIEAGTSETGWVKVSVKKAYLGDEDNDPKEIKFTVTYKADAVDRTELGNEVVIPYVRLQEGLYDANDNLLITWDYFDTYTNVGGDTINYLWSGYSPSAFVLIGCETEYTFSPIPKLDASNKQAPCELDTKDKDIRKIVLPNDMTKIGKAALFGLNKQGAQIEEIVLPDAIETIDELGVANNATLSKITYKGVTYTSVSALMAALTANGVTIGNGAFSSNALGD